MPSLTINYITVLVTAIISMAIGAFWYSPMLFGKLWMTLSGMTEVQLQEGKKKGMGKTYVLAFIGTFLMSHVLAYVVGYANAATVGAGLHVGFWTWLGFVAPVTLGGVLWEGKSWKLWCLNNAHYLVVLLVSGVILALWL